MDLKKEITEMIYKNSNDTSEGVLIDFKVIPPLIENIVAITVTHSCKRDSEQLKGEHPLTFAKWREKNGYTPYDNSSYQKNNEVINVGKLEIKYRAYYKTFNCLERFV